MSDMAKKPQSGHIPSGQMTLFEELIDEAGGVFHWPDHRYDRTIRNVAAGQVIVRQGGAPDRVFEIISGTLKLSQVTEDGRQIILGFPAAGEAVGLTAGPEYRYAAETLTIARLRPVLRKAMYRQISGDRQARAQWLGWIDAREQMVQDHLAILSLNGPLPRLATFLLAQNTRQMKRAGRDDGVIDLPMTQRDIASYLAIAPETCSRTMKKLRTDAVIEAGVRNGDGRRIKILNRERLARAAIGSSP